jgi:oligoribonuclease (3'-5' exoribonuclease)
MSRHPAHGLVLDLETTDSDPRLPHASILEIGAVLVTLDRDVQIVAQASLTIRPPGSQPDHDMMWAAMPPVVQTMHRDSGLWEEATVGEDTWAIHEADTALVSWINEHVDADVAIPIIGSGVSHLDVPFVREFMPRLTRRTTYWSLDVGHLRRALQIAGRDDHVDLVTDVDGKPHRGLDDALLHAAELRRYLSVLASLPGAGVNVPVGADPAPHAMP